MNRRIYLIFYTSFFPSILFAQNLESIGKEKPIKVNGGLSLNQIYYTSDGTRNSRQPFSYFASGNLGVSLYGWTIPISFNLSNQNFGFTQPFNQYSVHPTYKSVSAHLGYISSSFSPYTVNGHLFLGAGVDYSGGSRWKLSALAGRFLKRANYHSGLPNSTPAFRRMGYAIKATYAIESDQVELIVFRAADELNSIRPLPDSLNIFPQENLVVSLGAGKVLFDKFFFKAESAISALNHDSRNETIQVSHPLSDIGPFFRARTSSSFYNSYKASFDFRQEYFTIGIGYERIDPGFRTLGAYYFNSDLQNVTVNVTTSLLHGKLNVAASGGTQRDNLDKSKIATLNRNVASLNINLAATEKLNLSASYSNFQTFTNIRSQFQAINQLTPYENLDTLNFTQLSQNGTLNCSWIFGGNEKRKHNVNVNLSVQQAADSEANERGSGSQFYNANASYSLHLQQKNMSITSSINSSMNKSLNMDSKTWGPSMSINKAFFGKKLKCVLSSSANRSFINDHESSRVANCRLTTSISFQKKHNVSVSAVLVNRRNSAGALRNVQDFTGTLGYSYSFNL